MKTDSRVNSVSVVIPAYNEEGSIDILVKRLMAVLRGYPSYEIIFINDGSTDNTAGIINRWCEEYAGVVRAVHFRTNFGKSKALLSGFRRARGEIIIMMDADLQDNPEEIPKLITCLIENDLHVVTGWKKDRQDPRSKTIPSRFFNFIVRFFSGLTVHDFNCGLKVMRRECCRNMKLYGQLHRFILVLLAKQGFRIGEAPVEHSPRRFGVSKFGSKRLYEGFMDFLTVFFLTRYHQSPLYFFGIYGITCFAVAIVFGGYFIGLHFISYFMNNPSGMLSQHPLWLISPFLFVTGFIFIAFGLLGEMLLHLNFDWHDESLIETCVGFRFEDSPGQREKADGESSS